MSEDSKKEYYRLWWEFLTQSSIIGPLRAAAKLLKENEAFSSDADMPGGIEWDIAMLYTRIFWTLLLDENLSFDDFWRGADSPSVMDGFEYLNERVPYDVKREAFHRGRDGFEPLRHLPFHIENGVIYKDEKIPVHIKEGMLYKDGDEEPLGELPFLFTSGHFYSERNGDIPFYINKDGEFYRYGGGRESDAIRPSNFEEGVIYDNDFLRANNALLKFKEYAEEDRRLLLAINLNGEKPVDDVLEEVRDQINKAKTDEFRCFPIRNGPDLIKRRLNVYTHYVKYNGSDEKPAKYGTWPYIWQRTSGSQAGYRADRKSDYRDELKRNFKAAKKTMKNIENGKFP